MREMMEFFKAHYAKREYRVAMRDGAKLYTVVYTPIAGTVSGCGAVSVPDVAHAL